MRVNENLQAHLVEHRREFARRRCRLDDACGHRTETICVAAHGGKLHVLGVELVLFKNSACEQIGQGTR